MRRSLSAFLFLIYSLLSMQNAYAEVRSCVEVLEIGCRSGKLSGEELNNCCSEDVSRANKEAKAGLKALGKAAGEQLGLQGNTWKDIPEGSLFEVKLPPSNTTIFFNSSNRGAPRTSEVLKTAEQLSIRNCNEIIADPHSILSLQNLCFKFINNKLARAATFSESSNDNCANSDVKTEYLQNPVNQPTLTITSSTASNTPTIQNIQSYEITGTNIKTGKLERILYCENTDRYTTCINRDTATLSTRGGTPTFGVTASLNQNSIVGIKANSSIGSLDANLKAEGKIEADIIIPAIIPGSSNLKINCEIDPADSKTECKSYGTLNQDLNTRYTISHDSAGATHTTISQPLSARTNATITDNNGTSNVGLSFSGYTGAQITVYSLTDGKGGGISFSAPLGK